MSTVDYKLANVLLRVDDHAALHPELYYRAAASVATFDEEAKALSFAGPVDFLTYLNACSANKWSQYAGIDSVWLHAEVKGEGEIIIEGVASDGTDRRELSRHAFASHDEFVVVDIEIPTAGEDLVGFSMVPAEGDSAQASRAWWYAKVDEDSINPVRLAIATTTFKKEAYITANIDLVQEAVRAEGAPIMGNFHMFVVDNGQTLDAKALSDDLVTVIPNPNVGGSGGFARGMMAATEVPGAYTHVLVMDDDVRIVAESLIRTFNLLSLAQGKYRTAYINGAMLSLEEPTRQFEDVSYVVNSGVYRRVKPDLNVGLLEDIVENERIDVEVPSAYGAWWFSCIPTVDVERNGLPMPFFIRCDDVEFGMRNDPTYMTMNGICVWHESFEGRYRASVDCYQCTRNFLAMIAVDDCASESLFIVRLVRSVRQSLRELDYVSAEFLLDGLDDYLKGPDYLARLDGSALMQANGKRNEKVVPVEEMDPAVLQAAGVTPEVLANTSLDFHHSPFMKCWRSVPYDKHYMPKPFLGHRAGYVVKNGTCSLEGNTTGCETVVYLDPTRKKGAIRHMDRARFRAIRIREHELMRRYRSEGKRIRQAWKDALPRLTSREFWTEYLGL